MRDSEEPPETVGDLMTVDLVALLPTDRVERARSVLLTLGIHALPVMEGNNVVGIVTSTDLIDEWSEDEVITSVMTPTPTLIGVEATLQEAADVMLAERTHHLMVTDDTEVIGIVSTFDLLEALSSPVASAG
ncbi:MAG: CBS domain-containing protein [Actinomycetia bacterium]|nr:CBS domain-containing protein [Actinomycetes bacterium]MCP4223997.1 CBS domain-containing protein [Actinomycetes bacterium]MCP5034136.1 CBS domain-containing protein [Actinomycetes bacterium]